MSTLAFAPTRPRPRALAGSALVALTILVAPMAARAGGGGGTSNGYSTFDDGTRFSWALYDPRSGSSTCTSDGEDWRVILRDLRGETSQVLWFKLDDRAYIVRDPGLVDRADEIVAPVRELGRRQGELGARQGHLGGRQAALGGKQAALGARQAALSVRLASLETRVNRDGDDELRAELEQIRDDLRELGELQSQLAREQGPLSQAQGELGRTQGELGREQARVSRQAGIELRKLAEEAVRTGKAERSRSRGRLSA